MRILHRSLIAIPLALGLSVVACDDDDDTITAPPAPLVPSATATPAPAPAPTAAMTPTPSSPQTGEQIGFLGRIRSIRGPRMGIGSYEVVTNGETEFRRNDQAASLGDFSEGEDVRVLGEVLGDGSVLAIRVSLLPQ